MQAGWMEFVFHDKQVVQRVIRCDLAHANKSSDEFVQDMPTPVRAEVNATVAMAVCKLRRGSHHRPLTRLGRRPSCSI